MTEISLNKYLDRPDVNQTSLAGRLGVSQGAISQALRSSRDVYVVEHADGRVEAYERRPFGRRRQIESSQQVG